MWMRFVHILWLVFSPSHCSTYLYNVCAPKLSWLTWEMCSVVWTCNMEVKLWYGQTRTHSKSFFKFSLKNDPVSQIVHLNIESIENRFLKNDVSFIYKVVSSKFYSPALFTPAAVHFYVSQRPLRTVPTFHITSHSTNLPFTSHIMNRMFRDRNDKLYSLDVFSLKDFNHFKSYCSKLLIKIVNLFISIYYVDINVIDCTVFAVVV